MKKILKKAKNRQKKTLIFVSEDRKGCIESFWVLIKLMRGLALSSAKSQTASWLPSLKCPNACKIAFF